MKTIFNPGILVHGSTYFVTNKVTQDKNLKEKTSFEALVILEDSSFLPLSSDRELLFYLELSVTETLLSFSSENEDKVFNPGIVISKGVRSFTLGLSHRTYETFKIINIYPTILNEEIPSDKSEVHIEVLSVLWGNRLPILDGSLPLS
ncbi:hypothetical protein Tco_0264947, partial [Tanacetum coccineum]